jgi:hypothetical protein
MSLLVPPPEQSTGRQGARAVCRLLQRLGRLPRLSVEALLGRQGQQP